MEPSGFPPSTYSRQRVFRGMRTAQRAPRPPFWAYGGNVQFMPWMVYNLCQSRSGYNGPSSQWDIPCFFGLILTLYWPYMVGYGWYLQ